MTHIMNTRLGEKKINKKFLFITFLFRSGMDPSWVMQKNLASRLVCMFWTVCKARNRITVEDDVISIQ